MAEHGKQAFPRGRSDTRIHHFLLQQNQRELVREAMLPDVSRAALALGNGVNANQYVMAGPRVYADDTPVPTLALDKGTMVTGRLWAYGRDERDGHQVGLSYQDQSWHVRSISNNE
ncbi:IS66 family transposase [Robbsia andropogonis]|uniref:IS66 family transposase n=1 Tax=Robbsia andropogonis TaxID=28092 RepID=UPI003D230420